MCKFRSKAFLAQGVLAVVTAAGCEKTFPVTVYPEFYSPELKTVAVLPFSNASLEPRAGQFVTERVVSALKENRTYEVLGPAELKARLAAVGVNLPSDPPPGLATDALRRLGGVQAFVIGRVTAFDAETYRRGAVHFAASYGYGSGHHRHRRHGRGYYDPYYDYGYYDPIYYYRTYGHAYAAVEVALVSVASGETIYSSAGPISARADYVGDPPVTGESLLAEAAASVSREVVNRLAVVPGLVKVDPGRDLRTARRADGGEIEFDDDFDADEEEILVLLRLPPEADRNGFRLTIAAEDADQELAAESFVWSRKDQVRQFVFSPLELSRAFGRGEYEVGFQAHDKVIMKRKFRLK